VRRGWAVVTWTGHTVGVTAGGSKVKTPALLPRVRGAEFSSRSVRDAVSQPIDLTAIDLRDIHSYRLTRARLAWSRSLANVDQARHTDPPAVQYSDHSTGFNTRNMPPSHLITAVHGGGTRLPARQVACWIAITSGVHHRGHNADSMSACLRHASLPDAYPCPQVASCALLLLARRFRLRPYRLPVVCSRCVSASSTTSKPGDDARSAALIAVAMAQETRPLTRLPIWQRPRLRIGPMGEGRYTLAEAA